MMDPDKIGFVLWEAITLLIVIFGGIGLTVLRRRARGRPGFTNQDRQLFFGDSIARMSKLRVVLNFGLAVVLCFVIGFFEIMIFAPLGAGLLTAILLLTCLGIVNKLLF
jgi:hypothetical protein